MKKIEDYVPEGNLNVYKNIYNRISSINLKQYKLKREKRAIASIERRLQDIFKNEAAIKRIIVNVWKEFNMDNPRNFAATIAEIFLKRKTYEAIDILIYCILKDCKIYSNKYHWKALLKYFYETELINIDEDDELIVYDCGSLKKRFERLDDKVIEDWLLFYSVFCSNKEPLISADLAKDYDKRGFLNSLNDDPFAIPPPENPLALKNRYMKN